MSNLLPVRLVERPWGRDVLPPPFVAPEGQRIGEVWFENFRGFAKLLIKYLFTSQNLSVQVHPSDAQAPGEGKEECWYVLDAEPGARIGIGLCEEASAEAVRRAALDGSIEQMLAWHEVAAGDFFYIPAGTIHAIGTGISLIEVQQNSDTTYRLYDYGRDRPLHLDEGLAVARTGPHPAELRRSLPDNGNVMLADGPCFRLDRIEGPPDAATRARYGGGLFLVIPLSKAVHVLDDHVQAGDCAIASFLDEISFAEDGVCLLAQPCTP
ncbi:MAG: class I mannose-6-phosphate isomerase [Novosphingobium sp.]